MMTSMLFVFESLLRPGQLGWIVLVELWAKYLIKLINLEVVGA